MTAIQDTLRDHRKALLAEPKPEDSEWSYKLHFLFALHFQRNRDMRQRLPTKKAIQALLKEELPRGIKVKVEHVQSVWAELSGARLFIIGPIFGSHGSWPDNDDELEAAKTKVVESMRNDMIAVDGDMPEAVKHYNMSLWVRSTTIEGINMDDVAVGVWEGHGMPEPVVRPAGY